MYDDAATTIGNTVVVGQGSQPHTRLSSSYRKALRVVIVGVCDSESGNADRQPHCKGASGAARYLCGI